MGLKEIRIRQLMKRPMKDNKLKHKAYQQRYKNRLIRFKESYYEAKRHEEWIIKNRKLFNKDIFGEKGVIKRLIKEYHKTNLDYGKDLIEDTINDLRNIEHEDNQFDYKERRFELIDEQTDWQWLYKQYTGKEIPKEI